MLTAASESMSRLPGASGARDMAMCRAAARFQVGRMPAGDVAHASGSGFCPIFRAELQRLRGGKWNFYSSTLEEGREPRTS